MTFATPADFAARLGDLPGPDETAGAAAGARNAQLTKPPGALGRLEDLAVWYAGWRGAVAPVAAPRVIVFAGNHGVAARGVSAFPAEVTAQMVANFRAGRAAINQIARVAGAQLHVHGLDLDTPTADFTESPAMTDIELAASLSAGWDAVDEKADLLVVGEMGIGNTTSAAALCAALWGGAGADWAGRGTGVDAAGLARKIAVIDAGLDRHAPALAATDGAARALLALQSVGGRESAAMAGAIVRARHLRVPVILDGFICCAAASVLEAAAPGALDHAVAGHASTEAGHWRLLERLGKVPLLSLGLRLGEGTGGALAIGVMRAATECLAGMATFEEAHMAEG